MSDCQDSPESATAPSKPVSLNSKPAQPLPAPSQPSDDHVPSAFQHPVGSPADAPERPETVQLPIPAISTYLIDLPSLTPSKSNTSETDSDSESIPDGFTDLDEEDDRSNHEEACKLVDSLHIDNQTLVEQPLRTPAGNLGSSNLQHNSLSEPGPARSHRFSRKRSLSELVALRYRGGKGESEIGEEERGLLALDLGAYINSGDPDLPPETKPIPPSGLFPTLEALISSTPPSSHVATTVPTHKVSAYPTSHGLPLPPPRSEWPFGGTGPGKTSRGFIPGRRSHKPLS